MTGKKDPNLERGKRRKDKEEEQEEEEKTTASRMEELDLEDGGAEADKKVRESRDLVCKFGGRRLEKKTVRRLSLCLFDSFLSFF